MSNNHLLRIRLLAFPLVILLGLSTALPASAQISIALDSAGSTNIDLGAAGPNKSIDFYIGQNTGSNNDLGAIFAVVTLSGGVVANPVGMISADGVGTPGYFAAGNLVVSTISQGANNSQFEINQFFDASQPIMTNANRELWFTLNLDTTGLAAANYTISLEDSNGSFRAGSGAFIVANNNLTFTVSTVLLGDVDQNGVVNFLDISPFIALLSSGGDQAEADVNQDNVVNFLDISPFITVLSN